jgi:hypothetical protein
VKPFEIDTLVKAIKRTHKLKSIYKGKIEENTNGFIATSPALDKALYIAKKMNEFMSIVSVEPNIKECGGLDLVDIKTGLESDICIYLVGHKEFRNENMKETDLVFCEINNN